METGNVDSTINGKWKEFLDSDCLGWAMLLPYHGDITITVAGRLYDDEVLNLQVCVSRPSSSFILGASVTRAPAFCAAPTHHKKGYQGLALLQSID